DVAPPRLQSDAVPWGHPAGRKRVPPLRQRVAAGRTEIARAVVITRTRVRLDVQRGGVRPYQIEAQRAQGAERLRVIERYVDAALLLESEIGQWIVDIAEGREPDRARRIAMHHGAELRVVVEHALLDDQVRAVARYQILDLDVEDVERRAERGQEGWRRHDAERVGIGDLRLQVRIAAGPAVVLAGRVGGRAEDSVLRGGKPAARALGGRRRGPGAGGRAGARIDRAVEADDIVGEELGDVRRAHCAVVAAAEAQARGRRVVQTDFVGVGRIADVVLRIAVRHVQRDFLHQRLVLDERQPRLEERFLDAVARIHRGGRSADAGEQAVQDHIVGLYLHELLAVLGAEVQAQAFARRRQLESGLGQVGGEIRVEDPLFGDALDDRGGLHVGDRRRVDRARAPDVPWH